MKKQIRLIRVFRYHFFCYYEILMFITHFMRGRRNSIRLTRHSLNLPLIIVKMKANVKAISWKDFFFFLFETLIHSKRSWQQKYIDFFWSICSINILVSGYCLTMLLLELLYYSVITTFLWLSLLCIHLSPQVCSLNLFSFSK